MRKSDIPEINPNKYGAKDFASQSEWISIEDELKAVRDFIYFVTETGQLSGQDNDFLKAMYYDFKSSLTSQHNRG